ncbi:MAG TPA: hypothetical protein V6C81_00650 [Planktothrix sp.]
MSDWNRDKSAHHIWCGTLPSLLLALSIAVSLHVPAQAQGFRGASGLQGKTIFLPVGTSFEGRIDTTIGSSKSKQGQRFNIITASPILGNGTDVIIPAGAKVVGEVVEAIPAGDVGHPKHYKPYGRLRVQLTSLQMPDGMTYPLVASLMPESYAERNKKSNNPNLGGGLGYSGSQASLNAVRPGMGGRNNSQRGMLSKNDLAKDPFYGGGGDMSGKSGSGNQGSGVIRSLVPKGHELYIFEGSPLSIRLDAPLKIGIAAAPGAESLYDRAAEVSNDGGKRFAREAPPQPQAAQQDGALPQQQQQQQNEPAQGGLPFLQSPLTPAGGAGPLPAPGTQPGGPLPAPTPPAAAVQQSAPAQQTAPTDPGLKPPMQGGAPGATF